MILHPASLGLLAGAAFCLLFLCQAAVVAVRILTGWNRDDAGEKQLRLERLTHLESALLRLVFALQAASLLLFLYSADLYAHFIPGAMCATGVLQASPAGWYVLLVKGLLFFLASGWLLLNRWDRLGDRYPLIRPKNLLLLVILPLAAADALLLSRFIGGLRTDLITSCCGVLFESGGTSVAGELAGLPPLTMLAVFYGHALVLLLVLFACLWRPAVVLRGMLAIVALTFFATSLLALISVFSLYIYELPTHHCPFDMLQREYGFIGYPVYLSLLGATLAGCVPLLMAFCRRWAGDGLFPAGEEKRWLRLCLILLAVLLLLTGWVVLRSALSLR
ncbi:MAG: hypothetical protein AB1568_12900 [Thermodesulfobacteriota bacterium]